MISLVGDNPKQWNLCLPQAEFAFNSMPNRSIGCAPFIAIYGHQPNQVMNTAIVPSENAVVENLVQRSQTISVKGPTEADGVKKKIQRASR